MDDDRSFLLMIEKFFTRNGFVVFFATDGEKGMTLFQAEKPAIVLVDLRMPVMDGFAVLRAITEQSPDTPVIVISGEGEMADVIQSLRYGAWNYLAKPVDNLPIILHAVEQALEKARLVKENKAYQNKLEELVDKKTRQLQKTLHVLQQNESKLRTIIENFDGFIFTCDKDFRITYMNPSLLEYIGRDARGELCYETIFGLDKASCPWCTAEGAKSGQINNREILNPKDHRWYQIVYSTTVDWQGEVQEKQFILHDITERKKTLQELQEREESLRKQNQLLRSPQTGRYRFGRIIGKSPAMQQVYETIINAAASDAGVIIYGESGTGKELVAESIHQNSDRKEKQLVYVNCGAIPESLIESEFFGYRKGAFTGAERDKFGFLDLADGGTLFLDEVGEIPLSMQIKLLRAIEGGGFSPVGSTEVKRPEVRIIAATNCDLKKLVKNNRMRADFLYRIHIIDIHLPPLRERKEDIRLLIDHFLDDYGKDKIPPLSPEARRAILQYDWPGNVRELQNTLHRFVTLKKLDFIGSDLLEGEKGRYVPAVRMDPEAGLTDTVEQFEREMLRQVLVGHKWHKGRVARALKVDRKTLFNKIKKYDLE